MNTTLTTKASHVNTGTAFPRQDLHRSGKRGGALRHPRLKMQVSSGDVTPYGGLALAVDLVRRLAVPRALNGALSLLRSHRPFTEADHILTHAYNLFVGGTCIEDIANLQGSEPVRRMLGAVRIPDPTTAGDFLRRFGRRDLGKLDDAIDHVQEQAWRVRYGRRRQPLAVVDIDSHLKKVYGAKKEGADFSYKGTWSYHPLVMSLAGTQECLRLVNRPGNAGDRDGVVGHLKVLFPRLNRRFKKVVVRGDSQFFSSAIFETCEEHGQYFAIVSPTFQNLMRQAEKLPGSRWKPFVPRSQRGRTPPKPKRKRRRNRRRKIVLQRRMRDLKLEKQWVAEFRYSPTRCASTFRVIVRRQRIEETKQGMLFELWRYRFLITNLRGSAQDVVDLTYQRCDQENVIEQLQNGVAAMRMPTGSFLANAAFLRCARLAHNIKCWLALLALPAETTRWEWKRFRQAFVFVAARVVLRARQVWIDLANSHRYHRDILKAHARLQL